MAEFNYGMVAIIGICCALGVCLLGLLIAIIIYCRMRIKDDTNIRKRILGSQTVGGYAQEEVKTHIIEEAPRQIIVPAPMPVPVPERHYVHESLPALPAPPPQPQQPEIVVHEVVHRYEPPPQQIVLPAPQPQAQRLVRRSSWSAPHQHSDEWIMIKKKKKRGTRVVAVEDSDSSEDEEVVTRQHRCQPCMNPSLNPYDLAVPRYGYQAPPMAAMGVGMGMGQASYMVGARPMATQVYGVAPAAPMMMAAPMMTGGASTFQPTYGMVPRM